MQFLIKKCIQDSDNVKSAAVRTAYGQFSSVVGILCNALLCVGKMVVGTLSGSVSVTADAINNLSDASSSIISLLGFKLANRPADEQHPYGHGRYEYLAGLMVAALILVIGIELLKSSVEKILHPSPVAFSWVTVIVLAASIAIKLWMMRLNQRIGKTIGSQALAATAADSRNDVITTSAVLIAALISRFTPLELDGWIGVLVAVFILVSGFGLIRDTLDPLLGHAPDRDAVKRIRDKIMSYPGVLGTHDLMVHDYGPGRQFASVHVEMAAEADVLENHDVIDNIEHDFLAQEGLHLIVHFDPILTADGATNDLRKWLAEIVHAIHPELSVHDLRVVAGPTHTNLVFDCVLPHGVPITDASLKASISALVAAEHPTYRCVITVDRSYAALPHA